MRRPTSSSMRLLAVALLAIATIGILMFPRTGAKRVWTARVTVEAALADGLLLREVTFETPDGDPFTAQCVSGVARTSRVELVDVRSFTADPLRTALDRTHGGCAVNGGYFDPQFRPAGLMRIDGIEMSPVSAKPLLSGCLLAGAREPVRLVPVRSASVSTAKSVRQCGPMLVGPREALGNRIARAERTAIAVSAERVAVLTTSPTSLDDLAQALTDCGDALGVPRPTAALNLDGGPSSGLMYVGSMGPVGREPRGRITDAVVLHGTSPRPTGAGFKSGESPARGLVP